jgi:dUTP pyrophosphatase
MNLRIKMQRLSPKAILPLKATPGAAGYDLTAVSVERNEELNSWTYDTGVALEIPEGYEGQLRARSNVAKKGVYLANGVGTIDSDYRGSIRAVFIGTLKPYEVGERIAQLVLAKVETCNFQVVESLDETTRGEGGFGSTGTGRMSNV